MKFARFIAVLLGLFAAALMALSVGLCLVSLDAKPVVVQMPAGAVECAEALKTAVNEKDYAAISAVIYGQPNLGAEGIPEQTAGILIWDAFKASLSLEFKGKCYATDSGIAWDAEITSLDITSVTEALSKHAHALLTERVENAEQMTELYDENNNFRQELVAEVLNEAVLRALEEDGKVVTREVTLNLIFRDGAWWILADQPLLQSLSGGLA